MEVSMFQLVAITIFVITFIGIISEKIHRSLVALLGATSMAIFGDMLGFYSFEAVGQAVDYNTLLVLAGMMLIVAVMEKTGIFEYLAIYIAKRNHTSYWKLLISLSLLTTLLSMVLDNVTTIILIAPITLTIAKILHFNPVPLLLSQALLSNIGGTGTLIGDLPNIIISSAAGFHFISFIVYALPVVIVSWVCCLGYILITNKKENTFKPKYREKLLEMKENHMITKPIVLIKSLIILGIVIFLFFIHHLLHIPPSAVAILGAVSLLLLVAPHDNPQKYLKKLQLSVFVFFGSLFVLVGGLEAAGVFDNIAVLIAELAKNNLILTAIAVLWVSAIASAIIDNIPMTIAMIPIISYLETNGVIGASILWWALVFGVGFGGNLSPLGSTANIVVISKLEIDGKKIQIQDWLRIGFPVSLISLGVASLALVLFGAYFVI